MITQEKLQAIRAFLEDFQNYPRSQSNCATMTDYALQTIPQLVDEIERLRGEVEQLKEFLSESVPGEE